MRRLSGSAPRAGGAVGIIPHMRGVALAAVLESAFTEEAHG
jgi:hypothetical protein